MISFSSLGYYDLAYTQISPTFIVNMTLFLCIFHKFNVEIFFAQYLNYKIYNNL